MRASRTRCMLFPYLEELRGRSRGLSDVVFNYYIIFFSFFVYFLLSLQFLHFYHFLLVFYQFVLVLLLVFTDFFTNFFIFYSLVLIFCFFVVVVFINCEQFSLKSMSISCLSLTDQVTEQFNLRLCLFVFMILITIAFSYVCMYLLCVKY